MYAYKHKTEKNILIENLELARNEALQAQGSLFEAQHGVFSTWYSNADPLSRTFQIDELIRNIDGLILKARSL